MQAFQHSWTGYVQYAWGMDELAPLSKAGRNSFGGVGATLIDALDTLHLMGLHEEFQRCAPCLRLACTPPHVCRTRLQALHLPCCLECTLQASLLSLQGIVASRACAFARHRWILHCVCRGQDWVAAELDLQHDAKLSLFETVIRIVGGLLSAYDASHNATFLESADELAGKVMLNMLSDGTGGARCMHAWVLDGLPPSGFSSRGCLQAAAPMCCRSSLGSAAMLGRDAEEGSVSIAL